MAKRLSNEEFLERLAKVNPTVEALSPYMGSNKKIQFKCKTCGHEWKAIASSVATNNSVTGLPTGCPKCKSNKLTNDMFLQMLHAANPTIIPIGKYININTNMKFRCNKCNHEWECRPYSVIHCNSVTGRVTGCPKCSAKSRAEQNTITEFKFKQKMSDIRPDLVVLESYKGSIQKVKVKSLICGHIWKAKPSYLWSVDIGVGCPECAGLTHNDKWFKEKMEKTHSNIMVLGKYKTLQDNLELQCKICGNKWYGKPNTLLYQNGGCPFCKGSHGEKRVSEVLTKMNVDFCVQKTFPDCVDKRNLKFDFYIPSKNLCIEFDGKQHFEPIDFFGQGDGKTYLHETQRRDEIKKQYCLKNNIALLRIPYWEFNNIENIIKEKLIS